MKISELPLTTSVDGSEILPIVQGGTTKKVSITDALAGAGGGGTNPTTNYLPFNDGGTFADSYLNQGNVLLETIFEGENWGFKIDLNDGSLKLGDFNNILYGTKLIVADSITNQYISTLWGGFNLGFKLDYTNNVYSFGDFETNIGGRCIIIDDDNKIIQTKSDGSDIGFKFDFDASLTSFIPSATSNTRLFLGSLGGNEVLSLQTADGSEYGIKINKTENSYSFGDFDGWNNGNAILINDNTNNIIISGQVTSIYSGGGSISTNSNDATVIIGDADSSFNGNTFGIDDNNSTLLASSTLLTGGSHSTSGQHLKIKVGGTNYVIELKNA